MWDVFCRVIDNHGDLGVCLRLARQLAGRGVPVRLWVDDTRALPWMAPDVARQACPGLTVRHWDEASRPEVLAMLSPSDVWVEAFGCELPEAFVAHGVMRCHRFNEQPPRWINLEYLCAEAFIERVHGLPSPVMSGPARGWTKHFFYPGFTPGTGGLLRETDLIDQQASHDRAGHRQQLCPHLTPHGRLMSLFCYEPPGLASWLNQLSADDHLLVTPGRAMSAVQAQGLPRTPWSALPLTDQAGFDRLLWSCDLNLVRGEDSLVRALWAGQPLIWHIYPQEDHAHHAKLTAFLDWLEAPASLRQFHAVWNGLERPNGKLWPPTELNLWAECVQAARQRLFKQTDLVTQLLAFVGH